jgi:rubredoxin
MRRALCALIWVGLEGKIEKKEAQATAAAFKKVKDSVCPRVGNIRKKDFQLKFTGVLMPELFPNGI